MAPGVVQPEVADIGAAKVRAFESGVDYLALALALWVFPDGVVETATGQVGMAEVEGFQLEIGADGSLEPGDGPGRENVWP